MDYGWTWKLVTGTNDDMHYLTVLKNWTFLHFEGYTAIVFMKCSGTSLAKFVE